MLVRSREFLVEHVRDFFVAEDDGRFVGCCAIAVLTHDLAEGTALVATVNAIVPSPCPLAVASDTQPASAEADHAHPGGRLPGRLPPRQRVPQCVSGRGPGRLAHRGGLRPHGDGRPRDRRRRHRLRAGRPRLGGDHQPPGGLVGGRRGPGRGVRFGAAGYHRGARGQGDRRGSRTHRAPGRRLGTVCPAGPRRRFTRPTRPFAQKARRLR